MQTYADVRRKRVNEKVTIEYHRTPKYQRDPMIMCCVFLTPNTRQKKKMFDVGSKLKWSLVLILDYIVP